MNIFITIGHFFMVFAGILIGGVIFFSFLKYIKKKYYPTWKFPDYISVGYAEYLYQKFIKRDLK